MIFRRKTFTIRDLLPIELVHYIFLNEKYYVDQLERLKLDMSFGNVQTCPMNSFLWNLMFKYKILDLRN